MSGLGGRGSLPPSAKCSAHIRASALVAWKPISAGIQGMPAVTRPCRQSAVSATFRDARGRSLTSHSVGSTLAHVIAEPFWVLVIAELIAAACFAIWLTQPSLQRSRPLRWTLIIATCAAGLAAILTLGAVVFSAFVFGMDSF
jgi:energy-converting hydrogenase Eha subunit A